MWLIKVILISVAFLCILSGGESVAEYNVNLSLQPSEEYIIRLAGHENSFFKRCKGAPEDELSWTQTSRIGQEKTVREIPSLTKDRVHVEPSEVGLDLVFRSISKEDEGRYTCSHDLGQQIHFDMFVVQPIDLSGSSANQSVQLDQTSARLVCLVKGHPYPVVSWRARGVNVRNSLGEHNTTDHKYVVDGTDLIINRVGKEDEGRYLCKAVQTVEKDAVVLYSDFKEKVIEFKIEQKPEWRDDSGQFYGYVTGTANLTCQAEAEPPAEFTWLDAENNPVSEGTVINTHNMSTLSIIVTHHNVFGAYTCIAENIHGRLEKVVMLTEGAKPGTPNINPVKIFAEGLQLEIREPQAEMFLKVEGFQVEFKEVDKNWEEASIMKLSLDVGELYNPGSRVYHIPGLSAQTLYHIRAKSRNKAGLSDASNIIYLKTNALSARALNHTSSVERTCVSSLTMSLCLILSTWCCLVS